MFGIRVTSYLYSENWRRPENCDCGGCRNWGRVQRGEATVEELGQDRLRCSQRFLVWKDKVPIHTQWNPLMACLWIVILGICFLNLYASMGVVAIVTAAGKNDLLTQYFKGSAYTAAWYIGLVDGTTAPTYSALDTMASHSGWTANTGWANAARPAWTGGTPASGSVDNSASPAAFNINAAGTIAGQFVVNDSTKGGTVGTLYSEGNFTQGNRTVANGDTLNCTATLTAA